MSGYFEVLPIDPTKFLKSLLLRKYYETHFGWAMLNYEQFMLKKIASQLKFIVH